MKKLFSCLLLVQCGSLLSSQANLPTQNTTATFTLGSGIYSKQWKSNEGLAHISLEKKDFITKDGALVTEPGIKITQPGAEEAELIVSLYTYNGKKYLSADFAKGDLVTTFSRKETPYIRFGQEDLIEFDVLLHPSDLSKSHARNFEYTFDKVGYWIEKIQKVASELGLGMVTAMPPEFYGGYLGGFTFSEKKDLLNYGIRETKKVSKLFPKSRQSDPLPSKFEKWHYLQELAGDYKVHLMPKSEEQMIHFLRVFLRELSINSQLRQNVQDFKISPHFRNTTTRDDILEFIEKAHGEIMPLVVIYPASSKESTQYVVDTLYRLFHDQDGLNILPRYNQKITSFIYVAQGNGGEKQHYDFLFEQPNLVYYRKDFETLRWPWPKNKEEYNSAPIVEVISPKGQVVQEAGKLILKDYHIKHPA